MCRNLAPGRFNNDFDIILVSDATAPGNRKHFESELEIVREYYGIVMDLAEFASCAPRWPAQKTRT